MITEVSKQKLQFPRFKSTFVYYSHLSSPQIDPEILKSDERRDVWVGRVGVGVDA